MGCHCIANCQRCTHFVEGLEEEIERLKAELVKSKHKAHGDIDCLGTGCYMCDEEEALEEG